MDVVWRRWTSNGVLDPTGPADTRRMLQDARTYGFTWMRVALSPFWPVDLRGAVDNPDKFWGVVDGVVADAAAANVSIGFDLAWNVRFWRHGYLLFCYLIFVILLLFVCCLLFVVDGGVSCGRFLRLWTLPMIPWGH